MQLKLFKFEGAGNDFVALEDLHGNAPVGDAASPLVRALCDRRRGLGADGVLVLSPPEAPGADFRMRYYNADGSAGEMCGNGARCIVRFARVLGLVRHEATFDTDAGRYTAILEDGGAFVRIGFPDIGTLPRPMELEAAGERWEADFLEVGVPHLVVWIEDPAAVDIEVVGAALRHHKALAPRGTNVNFAARKPGHDGALRIRTYERGVEAETLACGTGSVASAACHLTREGVKGSSQLRVIPTGGDELVVDLHCDGDGFRSVQLGGSARLVYTTVAWWNEAEGAIQPFPPDPPPAKK